MANYTVKQVSEMLKKNPETIRRWIRNGDLVASQGSRKAGNVISGESLEKFLMKMPKYAPLASSIFLSSTFSIALIAGVTLNSIISELLDRKNKEITPADIKKVLNKNIREKEKSIEKNKVAITKTQKMLSDLQQQLDADQKKLESYQYALDTWDLNSVADEINSKYLKEE